MEIDNIIDIIFLLLKILVIVFTLFHFLIALIVYRQIGQMKRVVRTKARGCIAFISLIHILILLGVLVFVFVLSFTT